tara:strand:+ start:10896 stop:12665 length:1770 start_codon:yes stop_codon:yes gene_type:complete
MNENTKIVNNIIKLWGHLTIRRRLHFKLLLLLMVFASIAEMFTITAVLPFLSVIATPDTVFNNQYVKPINNFLQLDSPDELRIAITIGFIVVAIIAGITRILLLTVSTKLLFAAGAELSADIYRRSLFQPYQIHVNRNSSELINVVFNKCGDVVFGVMMPIVTIISSSILFIGVTSVLIIIDPLVMLMTFSCFALLYFLILKVTSRKVKNNSKLIAEESTKAIQCLQEGVGGIRDVIISNAQNYYFTIYNRVISGLMVSQGNNSIIGATPRFILETIGIVIIAILSLYLSGRDGGIISVIPVLGALAIGAQRMLPTLQQCYSSVTSIKALEYPLRDVLNLLDQSIFERKSNRINTSPKLMSELILEDINFRYSPELPDALSGITIKILNGDRIGIVGETGGGKSTLVDIIMGLLLPTEGKMFFNGEEMNENNINTLQDCISHVPQNIYLADATIEKNIAFGVDKGDIDLDRVTSAAKTAQLHDFIVNLPDKYSTRVGENGAFLSGGQKQRLGIARALYRNSSFIIFDEATSALDAKTEMKVMQAIDNLGEEKTILMIAHRTTTLSNCSKIIKIENGKAVIVGNDLNDIN